MGSMFYGCTSLASTDPLSSWDVSSVTDMYDMFYGCTSLTSLNFSGWSKSKDVNTTGMFRGCTSLEKMALGANWAWTPGSSGSGGNPKPSSVYSPDGKWYSSDGTAYGYLELPSNKADTYYASPSLMP